jgi:hypothetical protein
VISWPACADGSDASTSSSAAQQIAAIVRQHPQQLPAVLRQVHDVLYSSNWQTRVYASKTLGLLAQQVPHYTPEQLAHAAPPVALQSVDDAAQDAAHLCSFDAAAVLKSGTEVLGVGNVVRPRYCAE